MFFISRNLRPSSSIGERSITWIRHTEKGFFFAMIGKEICKGNRNKSRLIVTGTIERKYVSFVTKVNEHKELCLKRSQWKIAV